MNEVPDRRPAGGVLHRATRFANDILVENALIWVACECVRRWPGSRQRLLDVGGHLVPNDTTVLEPHRAYATPRLVRHYEVEYAVPYGRASEALGLLDETLARHPVKTMFPVGVRFTAADDIPLSMSQGRDVVYIAVHAYRREDYRGLRSVRGPVPRLDGRPTGGKLHSLQSGELRRRIHAGTSSRRRAPPGSAGVFENGYLRRLLGPRRHPRLRRHDALSARHRHRRIERHRKETARRWSAAVPV